MGCLVRDRIGEAVNDLKILELRARLGTVTGDIKVPVRCTVCREVIAGKGMTDHAEGCLLSSSVQQKSANQQKGTKRKPKRAGSNTRGRKSPGAKDRGSNGRFVKKSPGLPTPLGGL